MQLSTTAVVVTVIVGSYLPNLFQQLVIVLELPGDVGQQAFVIMGKHHLRHTTPKKLRHKHASS